MLSLCPLPGEKKSWASAGRRLSILLQRVQALEVFVVSMACTLPWLFLSLMLLPPNSEGSWWIWAHSLARLTFPPLHRPLCQGGLDLSCLVSTGQAGSSPSGSRKPALPLI
jgi:hypothetical protein